MKHSLHVIDFQPKDISEAIEELRRLEKTGGMSGLMFVAKIKGRKRPLVGAAGCCVTDPLATVGAASYMLGAVYATTFNE